MLFLLLCLASSGQAALATQAKVGTPIERAQIDLQKMGGAIVNQLSWSPDGNELYLQTMTEDKKGLPKDLFHFLIAAEGGAFKKVAAPPDYAIAYWPWKSGQTAPDDLAFKIDVSADRHQGSATPTVYTMRLKGEVIGEWTNRAAVPGVTFGWGPAGSHLIAYSDKPAGRLVIMDATGARQSVEGTKDVIVPAWTNDGTRLAYLEGRGPNKYALVVATVSR
jgi:hypothetical protein